MMSIRPGRVLLSLKLYLAAMIALALAFVRGFDYPYWTMMVVYLLALDSTAAMRQKWLYMLGGTVTGAAVGMLVTLVFAQSEPAILCALIAVTGVAAFFAVGDRLPHFNGFLLIGTTALLIATPGITTPDHAWLRAVDRVQDFVVGAFVLFLVDTLLLAHASRDELGAVVDAWLAHLRSLTVAALRGEGRGEGRGAGPGIRARDTHAASVVTTMGRIDVLSSCLPFDRLSRGGRRREAAEAIRLRGLWLLPHLSRLGDLDAHRGAHGLPPSDHALREALAGWIEAGCPERTKAALHASLRARGGPAPALDDWSAWLARLQRRSLRGIFVLWCRIGAARANLSARRPSHSPLPARRSPTPQILAHVDLGFRLRIVAAAMLHMAGFALLWRALGWVAADVALAFVLCTCFFIVSARSPEPVAALLRIARVLAVALGFVFLYVTAILPHANSFMAVALALFPALFLLGLVVADPGNGLFAVLSLALMRLGNNGPAVDFAQVLNGAMALAIGIGSALVWMVLLVRLPLEQRRARVQREARADLHDVVRGREADVHAYRQRSLDRVVLLAQWGVPFAKASACANAMREMRIGTALLQARRRRPEAARLLATVALGPWVDGAADVPDAVDLLDVPDVPAAASLAASGPAPWLAVRLADVHLARDPLAAPPARLAGGTAS